MAMPAGLRMSTGGGYHDEKAAWVHSRNAALIGIEYDEGGACECEVNDRGNEGPDCNVVIPSNSWDPRTYIEAVLPPFIGGSLPMPSGFVPTVTVDAGTLAVHT